MCELGNLIKTLPCFSCGLRQLNNLSDADTGKQRALFIRTSLDAVKRCLSPTLVDLGNASHTLAIAFDRNERCTSDLTEIKDKYSDRAIG